MYLRLARALVPLFLALLVVGVLPARFAGRHAQDRAQVEALAQSVASRLDRPLEEGGFGTGDARFDSEWAFATAMMAGMGFGELAALDPRWLEPMERAMDQALRPELRAYDSLAWGRDAESVLELDEGHVAYLGYCNLLLSLHRVHRPDSRFAATNDAYTAALSRRFQRSPIGLVETYPGEIYPVDNAAGIGSIALHARATGQPQPAWLGPWLEELERRYVAEGLLVQRVEPSGEAGSPARGSGSALAAWFLRPVEGGLPQRLARGVQRELGGDWLGFGLVREYPPGLAGRGDVDSGPLIFGRSISATGFSIGAAGVVGDLQWQRELYATAWLFGAPHGGRFLAGGLLGDALLLAMQATDVEAWP